MNEQMNGWACPEDFSEEVAWELGSGTQMESHTLVQVLALSLTVLCDSRPALFSPETSVYSSE